MSEHIFVELKLNGLSRTANVDARALLVQLVRDELGAKGTRIGCLTGDCGACTVFLDGALTKSCLVLAAAAEQREVMTIEGCNSSLARRVQDAFVESNAFQCGYCTSGMILVAVDLLKSNPNPTPEEIRRALSGNLCRCTGYESIVSAISVAAKQLTIKSE